MVYLIRLILVVYVESVMPYSSTQAGLMSASICTGLCSSVPGRNLFGSTMLLAEFAQHLLHRLRVPSLQGYWHARRFEAGRCTITDTGPCTSPVSLPLQGPVTLQDCIDQWHSQHTSALLAFTPGTSLIVLQLMRFNAEGRGKWKRTVKSLHTISHVLDDVVVPVFVDLESTQCLYPRFKVASIIAHFGDRADSGHYRCLWNENNTALITDDASAVTACTPPLLEEISANAYLVFLTREHD